MVRLCKKLVFHGTESAMNYLWGYEVNIIPFFVSLGVLQEFRRNLGAGISKLAMEQKMDIC